MWVIAEMGLGCTNILAIVKSFCLPKDQNLIQNQVFKESKVFLAWQDFPAVRCWVALAAVTSILTLAA